MEGTATSTGSTTTGPTSFSDPSLTWSGDSSASTPTESTPAASASAETTSPSAETTLPDGTTPAQGEPPKERWNDILANARTKATQDAQAQFEQQYGWATKVNPQEFQQVSQLARTLSANPIEGLQQLIAEVRKDPQYDAQIRSLAARALAQGRQPAAPAEPQMVQVQLEDGSVVSLPRDPQAWLAHQQQQWTAAMEQKLQPLQQTHEQLQAERAAAVQQEQRSALHHDDVWTCATWPGMDGGEPGPSRERWRRLPDRSQRSPRSAARGLERGVAHAVVAPSSARRRKPSCWIPSKPKRRPSSSVNPGTRRRRLRRAGDVVFRPCR
jgi:hypothetical protein